MPFLVIGGDTVKVAVSGDATEARKRIGEVVPAFDGTTRSSRRATKREWRCVTPPLAVEDADDLVATLEGTPPVVCSGDFLGGSVSCVPDHVEVKFQRVAGATRKVVSFVLLEE